MSELIGIIPAAGRGTRLSTLPCSKELFPLGYEEVLQGGERCFRPRVVSQYILELMREAGVRRVFIVLGPGKDDIIEHYGDGKRFGLEIAYLYQEKLTGIPAALCLALPWIGRETILFGMPDTIIEPRRAFSVLLDRHVEREADLTMGLFKTDSPERFGMVDLIDDRPVRCIDKPLQSATEYMWGIAAWSWRFGDLIKEYVRANGQRASEMVLTDTFQMAIERGLSVEAVRFDDGVYIDIGTPADLLRAVKEYGALWHGLAMPGRVET